MEAKEAPKYSLAGKRVYVAGHRGMVGSAIVRRLATTGAIIITAGRERLDLRDQRSVGEFFREVRPQAVFLAAARVGGIYANDSLPADFLYDNLMIEANLIEASHQTEVEKLLFLGSSCIYPRAASQPMQESALLTGPLETTNEWYAIAKIAGIKLCQAYRKQHGHNFISAMPTNLYGPGDNFDLKTSHVLPALMRKAHEAKSVGASTLEIWGSGKPLREFLHVDDAADACVFLMEHYDGSEHINVGSGEEISIRALASLIAQAAGLKAEIVTDARKPDGTPRKLLDSSAIHALGWKKHVDLPSGIASTYRWFVDAVARHEVREIRPAPRS